MSTSPSCWRRGGGLPVSDAAFIALALTVLAFVGVLALVVLHAVARRVGSDEADAPR